MELYKKVFTLINEFSSACLEYNACKGYKEKQPQAVSALKNVKKLAKKILPLYEQLPQAAQSIELLEAFDLALKEEFPK